MFFHVLRKHISKVLRPFFEHRIVRLSRRLSTRRLYFQGVFFANIFLFCLLIYGFSEPARLPERLAEAAANLASSPITCLFHPPCSRRVCRTFSHVIINICSSKRFPAGAELLPRCSKRYLWESRPFPNTAEATRRTLPRQQALGYDKRAIQRYSVQKEYELESTLRSPSTTSSGAPNPSLDSMFGEVVGGQIELRKRKHLGLPTPSVRSSL
jgi:hypothetical protein